MSNNDAMNSEIRFLEEVEEKLKTRITEINALFLEWRKNRLRACMIIIGKTIRRWMSMVMKIMDNQQALLGEVNANNERLMKKQRL